MTEKVTTIDPAGHLKSDQAIADFIAAALVTDDSAYVAQALGVALHAKGITEATNQAKESRELLYRSFSAENDIALRTTLALLHALGIQLFAKSAGVSN